MAEMEAARAVPATLAEDLFFNRTGMDRGRVQTLLDGALLGAEDGPEIS